MSDMKGKLDDTSQQMSDLTTAKVKLETENVEITRQLEEAESELGGLTKAKVQLQVSVTD